MMKQMPYITSSGEVVETRPWDLGYARDTAYHVLDTFTDFIRTLFDFNTEPTSSSNGFIGRQNDFMASRGGGGIIGSGDILGCSSTG
ncbi:hypothetical protein ACOME3_006061 [Neoechinorhynchus agilis]